MADSSVKEGIREEIRNNLRVYCMQQAITSTTPALAARIAGPVKIR
jgi:hypothetical protein